MAGLKFEIKKIPFKETVPKIRVDLIPENLAIQKSNQYKDLQGNELLITADTMVILNSLIFGKPRNKAQAISILESLAGKTHKVVTGVALREENKLRSFSTTTLVYFDPIELNEIEDYVERYEPLDKAGSYGIQEGIGLTHIRKIEGCFYNVMGLPMRDLFRMLNDFWVS